jgi:TetR/AcrR family fatty acid metabolism transcriptional regulator
MKRQDRPQKIMQAAERLFTSRRFHEITMDDVAAAAGVAKGTLYSYFQDKDDLFFQTATSGFDELCELLNRVVPSEAPFEERLLGACRQISQFYDGRHQLLRMMQAEDGRMSHYKGSLRQRWVDKRRGLIAALAAILAQGVADGVIRQDIPPDVLSSLLLGMLRARAHDLVDAAPAMQSYELLIDIFRHGAGVNGRARRGQESRRSQR